MKKKKGPYTNSDWKTGVFTSGLVLTCNCDVGGSLWFIWLIMETQRALELAILTVCYPVNGDATLATCNAVTCIPVLSGPWDFLVQVQARTWSWRQNTAVHEWLRHQTHKGEILSNSHCWIPWRNIDPNSTGATCNTKRRLDSLNVCGIILIL